jgi:hypothetical protein
MTKGVELNAKDSDCTESDEEVSVSSSEGEDYIEEEYMISTSINNASPKKRQNTVVKTSKIIRRTETSLSQSTVDDKEQKEE